MAQVPLSRLFGNSPPLGVRSHDAVVVVPGIMGSELVEVETGRTLWGAGTVLGYAAHWGHRSGFDALAVTDTEREGRTGRVKATRLLSGPAWLPAFGGIEPYAKLRTALSRVVHPDAITEFAYDWRLSVEYNAVLLADRVQRHLYDWRHHPDHAAGRSAHPQQRDAQVVLVAHSMGGLVVRAMAALGNMDDVRTTITLGTPFGGSVKTIRALAEGRGLPVPLPADAVRHMAYTSPGLHDLLPAYRCHLVDGDARIPSAAVIAQLGGNGELAAEAMAREGRLARVPLPGHVLFNGIKQPTPRSFEFRDGEVRLLRYGYQRNADDSVRCDAAGRPIEDDQGGDGTVYRYAAALPGTTARSFAQQHGALQRTASILDNICGLITEAENLDIMLGSSDFGLDAPDDVVAGTPFQVEITGDVDPARLTCAVEDVAKQDQVVSRPDPKKTGTIGAAVSVRLSRAGLFRIQVSGGNDSVSTLVLSVAGGGDDAR